MSGFLKESEYERIFRIHKAAVCAYHYDLSKYSDSLFETYATPFPKRLNNAVNKRKAEYLVGRYSAVEALQRVGIRIDRLVKGDDGSPQWPDGIVGSISHTKDTAICVVSQNICYEFIGVDLENIMTYDTAIKLKHLILDQYEENMIQALPASFAALVTLIFSAKESIYKALYPTVKRYFDFHSVKLANISMESRCFEFILANDLCRKYTRGVVVKGRFYINCHSVLTLVLKEAMTLEGSSKVHRL